MRSLAALFALVTAACGGAGSPPPMETGDLELEPGLERRHDEAARPPGLDAGVDADAGVAGLDVEVVDQGSPDTGGPRIDLSVRDADVSDVLRMIATVADVSLVVADDVRARVTFQIRNVTWRQAIDVIAHLEQLQVEERDGVVMVRRAGVQPAP